MKSAAAFAMALVTAPDLKTARALAQSALRARVAACVNLVRGVESHYWWQGRLEKGQEVLLVFKTHRRLLDQLERKILQEHPYDTPEFLVLPLVKGSERYLQWLTSSVRPGSTRRKS